MTSGSSVGRRPMGFFGPFNKWWSKFFLDHGRRPSKTDIESWRADNISWRPELTVEDIVQHSKGRRDPEKNRQYFVEYRRKMKAAAKKPTRRTSRRRRNGGAAAARDADLDDDAEELAEGVEEDDEEQEEEDEERGPGQAAEGAAARFGAEGSVVLHVEAGRGAVADRAEGGAVLPALPPRPPAAAAVETVPRCASEPAGRCGPPCRGKSSSTGAGAFSSSALSGSEGESILPNGPAAAVISAASAAAAAAATVDATDSAAAGAGWWRGEQLEPRSAQLSCHASPQRGGGDDGDILVGAIPSHFAAVAASRAASSALPAVHLPELLLPSVAAAASGVRPSGLAPLGALFPAGAVTQIAVRRTRGPSTSALLRHASNMLSCGGEGANGGGLSHQGSIAATAGVAAVAATAAAEEVAPLPLPQETLLGMLGPADFGGAWGCGGLGPPSSWAADWESQSSWPAEADAAPATLAGCEAAAAACAGLATGAGSGYSSGSGAVDVARMGSSVGPLELVLAPILPPLSPAAACVAAAAAAAAAAKRPAASASALALDASRRVCGSKRTLDLAYAPSATSLTSLAEGQGGPEEPVPKQQHQGPYMQRPEHQHYEHPRQLSEVLVSPDVCGEGSSSSNGASSSSRAHAPELLLPQLSPAPCEPAPALPAGLSGTTGCGNVACWGRYSSADLPACGHACGGMLAQQDQAGSRLPALPLCNAVGNELRRGVSPTLPAEPAPCPMPTVFMMAGHSPACGAPAVLVHSSGANASPALQQHASGAVASLWECEEAEERALLRCGGGGDGSGGGPAASSFGAAAEAEARALDEEAGADALGWLDGLLVDPEAFDVITSASPRAAGGLLQRACFGSPLSPQQPLEQKQQQGHGTGAVAGSCGGDDGVLCSGGLISVSSHGGCGNSHGVFILV
ncbi:hypothetical protein HXX76_011262 [Chlamydomonas incerta]|uniref:Uncharacterized protein n=1 Tax=Chlamydomonas incerta TaxID=51695 RepID=A0A835SYZ5_CHLIN|nr:hypothetical protein HXX76_011262 [Chlamydomonas incerta]|eukprot:KAG2429020.1 hypothetical protein HXX76_011262 [Chlamydomonas incerta]